MKESHDDDENNIKSAKPSLGACSEYKYGSKSKVSTFFHKNGTENGG